MAFYETGTSSSMSDLVTKLHTFATGNSWIEDRLDTGNGISALHKGRCCVSFRWNTGTPLHLAMYQALGFERGVSAVAISAAGTGYAVNDVLTINSGTAVTHATIRVTSIGGGGTVTGILLLTAGIDYSVDPNTPSATTVSPAGGTGCTITCTMNGTNGGDPGQYCDDSGQGLVSNVNTNLAQSRGFFNIGNGAYPSYHFFTNSTGDYIHIVLEYSSGLYRHCGFGSIEKVGDWNGGEYVYGHTHRNTDPTSVVNTCLLDGLFVDTSGSNENEAATIHMEGMANAALPIKWGIMWNSSSGGFPTDRAGNAKVRTPGGFRANLITRGFGWIRSNDANAYMPMVPIGVMYWDTTPAPDNVYFLGFQKDVRMLNMAPWNPGQELTVGSDTWIVFPTVRKQFSAVTDESRNQGIAYKKNT